MGQILASLNSLLWGPVTIALLLGSGLYLTVKFRAFHILRFGSVLQGTLGTLLRRDGNKAKGSVTPFAAVMTALAGSMGVGNIAGVATAITLGGAGAVFWMWVSALFGMIIKYAEVVLAIQHRRTVTDRVGHEVAHLGGPMYYIEAATRGRLLPCCFAAFCVIGSFGMGNMSQSNTVAQAFADAWRAPSWASGLLCFAICALIMVGGSRRIIGVSSVIIPAISAIYMLGSAAVICVNAGAVPGVLAKIFAEAFDFRSAAVGAGTYGALAALRFGIARGIFSNEAGIGSAPIAHACADVKNPHEQGLWGIFEVFFDTIVVCTMTALVILVSGVFAPGQAADGITLTTAGFAGTFGALAPYFIAVAIFAYAIATISCWALYGERCVRYLFPRGDAPVLIYKFLFAACVFAGALVQMRAVWDLSDIFNALMIYPNMFAVLLLMRREKDKRRGNLFMRKASPRPPEKQKNT